MQLHQLRDIEEFYRAQLGREERTPHEEALWLDGAERILQGWTAALKGAGDQFKNIGPGQIQIFGK